MQRYVEAFHEATNSTIGLVPAVRDHELRARLILEEAVETVAAMGFHATAEMTPTGPGPITRFARDANPDELEVIDGLCDLLYVVFGSAVTMGIDLEPFFEEVHRANMEKTTGPKRADGKQLKPEGWQPPDHGPIFEKQLSRAQAWQRAINEIDDCWPSADADGWLHPGDPDYPYDEVMPEAAA